MERSRPGGAVGYLTGTVVREKGLRRFRQDTTKGKKPRGHLVPAFAVTMLERYSAELEPGELDLVFPSWRSGDDDRGQAVAGVS